MSSVRRDIAELLPWSNPNRKSQVRLPIGLPVCDGAYVGLEEFDDGIWTVYFGPLKLGRLLERHMKIEDALVDCTANCNPCPRTILLPMFPTAHSDLQVISQRHQIVST